MKIYTSEIHDAHRCVTQFRNTGGGGWFGFWGVVLVWFGGLVWFFWLVFAWFWVWFWLVRSLLLAGSVLSF